MFRNTPKRFLAAAIPLLIVALFFCVAGSALAADPGHPTTGGTSSCQTMNLDFICISTDSRLLGISGLLFFSLFLIHRVLNRGKNLAQQTGDALRPPPGSWKRFVEHVFFDTAYRQFSPARLYHTAVVDPQIYSA